ncbi:MAG: hypothetical protein HYV16_15980 [Gammaproteobacteria bacterium]|nr:hypothetical protein [Gammaproteobacteria bacterium]
MSLAAAWPALSQEWHANARLRLGVWLIAGVVCLYLWLVLHDARIAAYKALTAEQVRAEKMLRLSGQSQWLERSKAAKAMHMSLQAELGRAQSVGLAQAQVQSWLRGLLAPHGERVQLQIANPIADEKNPGLWRVPATMRGGLAPLKVLALLQQIEAHKPLTIVQSLRMSVGDNASFSIGLEVLYTAEKADGEGA